jgi:hypothetical protein
VTYAALRRRVLRLLESYPEGGLIPVDDLETIAADFRDLSEALEEKVDSPDYGSDREEEDSEDE